MLSYQELNNKLDLYFTDDVSTGSIFWTIRGALLYNNLIKIIRDLYATYGYTEVITPNIFENKLWLTSGHLSKYRENMFFLADHHHHTKDEINNELCTNNNNNNNNNDNQHTQEPTSTYALKPMNCPSHTLIYRHMNPYSKDLPIRLAEFGVLHRNEVSGALRGLTRVKRFICDDCHIFCRIDQIKQEVLNTLNMIKTVYALFDLKFSIKLSTRSEQYIGSLEIWDQAEKILEDLLKEFTGKSHIKRDEGASAFYGPKLDITLIDKYKRPVQCGTIQLDFNLPSAERFNLEYIDENTQERHHPVIIHRAVLGSVERFIGIILEHTQGRLPIQVSPYPIKIVTIHKDFNEQAHALKNHIHNTLIKRNVKLQVDIDDSTDDIKTKIKSAEKKCYCYILTVGKDEVESLKTDMDNALIAVRENKAISKKSVKDIIDLLENGTRLIN